jgi:dTDP-4-dehydrorhamnose reductase
MRILVTGASGRLGSYVMAQLALGNHDVIGWGRRHPGRAVSGRFQSVDLAESARFAEAIRLVDPEVVIHLAAMSSAESVRREPQAAWEINAEATRRLADWLIDNDRRLLFASTDLVFDGTRSFYREDDSPNPILEYGRTKRAAELIVASSSRNLTVRISLLYGKAPPGQDGFFDRSIASLRAGVPTHFFADEYRTPLDYATAALALVELAESNVSGLIHLGGPERLSRFELMRRAATVLGINPSLVVKTGLQQQSPAELRPADVSLDTSRLRTVIPGLNMPPIETALGSFDG